MRIEPVRQRNQHMERLLEIWETGVRKTHSFLSEADISSIRPEVRQGIAQIEQLYCACDDTGKIQGFIGIENVKIEMLFIAPRARGQGIGKQLVNFALTDRGQRLLTSTSKTSRVSVSISI